MYGNVNFPYSSVSLRRETKRPIDGQNPSYSLSPLSNPLNQGWTYHDEITPAHQGLTVLAYYSQRYHHSTEQEWLERISQGQVQINNRPTSPFARLETGQHLTYHRPPWQEPDVPLTVEIIYQHNDIWIINKPSGLPVLPGGQFLQHTLLHQLRNYYPHETPIPIHRLGRGTSGLMLLARTPLARSHLSQQLRERSIRKIYRTLISPGPIPDTLTLTQPIGKVPHPQLGHIYAATLTGSEAHSEIRVLRRSSKATLLEVHILTGRPHQIRIHLASAGFPLIGDPLYDIGGIPRQNPDGKTPVPSDCGYWLHAHQLGFIHPRTKEPITFSCPPPIQLR